MAKMTAEQRAKIDAEIRAQNAANKAKAIEANKRRSALNSKTSGGYKAPRPKVNAKAKVKKEKGSQPKTKVGKAIAARKRRLKEI